jgi:hypothetical protein
MPGPEVEGFSAQADGVSVDPVGVGIGMPPTNPATAWHYRLTIGWACIYVRNIEQRKPGENATWIDL